MPRPPVHEPESMKNWRGLYPDDQFLAEMMDRSQDQVPVNTAAGRYVGIIPLSRPEFTRLLLIIQELQNPLKPVAMAYCPVAMPEYARAEAVPPHPGPGMQGGAIGMEPSPADAPARILKRTAEMTRAQLDKAHEDVRALVSAGKVSTSILGEPWRKGELLRLTLDDYDLILPMSELIGVAGHLFPPAVPRD